MGLESWDIPPANLLRTAIVIFIATWLNPQAKIGILGLKLCFHILKILRNHDRHNDQP
jgi:hypothetical protein